MGRFTFIGKMKPSSIFKKYGTKLMLNSDELIEYSKGRNEMFVIEFENFEKFTKPVVPKRFITVSGKYVYENEFERIKKNND